MPLTYTEAHRLRVLVRALSKAEFKLGQLSPETPEPFRSSAYIAAERDASELASNFYGLTAKLTEPKL